MVTVNLFGGKQFKQGHLSIGSCKWILMAVIFCGKNFLSCVNDNTTQLCELFLQWNNKGFQKEDYLKHIYLIKILNSNELSEA